MNSPNLYLIALSLSFLLTACGSKRIDTSNDERMKKSIEEVRGSVSAADRAKFDESLTAITTSKINPADIFSGNTAGVEAKVKDSLAGKSASEIIAAGQAILEERRSKEREQASSEIAELRQKKQAAEKAKGELAKFKVTRSRFYRQEQRFGGAEPIIELALTNNTGVAISRAYFTGTLASPGIATLKGSHTILEGPLKGLGDSAVTAVLRKIDEDESAPSGISQTAPSKQPEASGSGR
jgi:hypothetical protein